MYFPRLSSVTVTSRSEWCCQVCLWRGCSQLQGLGVSWTQGNRRRRPMETRSFLVEGEQCPGGERASSETAERWITGDGGIWDYQLMLNFICIVCDHHIKAEYTYPPLNHISSRPPQPNHLDHAWTHTHTQNVVKPLHQRFKKEQKSFLFLCIQKQIHK